MTGLPESLFKFNVTVNSFAVNILPQGKEIVKNTKKKNFFFKQKYVQ